MNDTEVAPLGGLVRLHTTMTARLYYGAWEYASV